jgi:CRISPR/Cas system CSM-associated protein Csm5 (group 7 of RAMP superfamily)
MTNAAFIKNKTGFDSKISTKTFTIEVLTPVHVGSGREYTKNLDIVSTDDNTIVLDMDKVFRQFSDDPAFLKAIENGNIKTFLDRNGGAIKFAKLELPGSAEAGTVREFMTLAIGKPVIPGSSIKGGIRTALFAKLFKESGFTEKEYEALTAGGRKEFAAQKLEEKLLSTESGGKRPNYDLGRIFRVGDAELSSSDLEIMNIRVMNLQGKKGEVFRYGWKDLTTAHTTNPNFEQGTPISIIAAAVDSKSQTFKISLDLDAFTRINWPEAKKFGWQELSQIMNNHATVIINYELNFLKNIVLQDDDSKRIANDIDENVLRHAKPKDGKISWIQQVGWGTGWHSKTGLHIPNEWLDGVRKRFKLNANENSLKHEIYPKSRKVAGFPDDSESNEIPTFFMGWIKVTEV